MYICIAYFHVERSNIEVSACETGQDGWQGLLYDSSY